MASVTLAVTAGRAADGWSLMLMMEKPMTDDSIERIQNSHVERGNGDIPRKIHNQCINDKGHFDWGDHFKSVIKLLAMPSLKIYMVVFQPVLALYLTKRDHSN